MRFIKLTSGALLLAFCFAGCEQKQAQLIEMREEFDKKIEAKDKEIDELKRKSDSLAQQNGQLQMQLAKSSEQGRIPDNLAADIADKVSQKLQQNQQSQPDNSAAFSSLNSKLDQLQALVASRANAPVAAQPLPTQPAIPRQLPVQPTPGPRPVHNITESSEGPVKVIPMSFGDEKR